jgi:hypothetical protein
VGRDLVFGASENDYITSMDFINKNRLYIGITAVGSLIGAAMY